VVGAVCVCAVSSGAMLSPARRAAASRRRDLPQPSGGDSVKIRHFTDDSGDCSFATFTLPFQRTFPSTVASPTRVNHGGRGTSSKLPPRISGTGRRVPRNLEWGTLMI